MNCGCPYYASNHHRTIYVREKTQAQRQGFPGRQVGQKAKYAWVPVGVMCTRCKSTLLAGFSQAVAPVPNSTQGVVT